MERPRFEHWVEQIYKTEEVELDCTECFDSVSSYVEALLAGEPGSENMRLVKQHLEQCRVCNEEFETLYELARQERESQTQPPGD
jgi:predicted anti-sigma-YlaC factor YlaD